MDTVILIIEASGQGGRHYLENNDYDNDVVREHFPNAELVEVPNYVEERTIYHSKKRVMVALLDDDGLFIPSETDKRKPQCREVEIYGYDLPEKDWFENGRNHGSTQFSTCVRHYRTVEKYFYAMIIDNTLELANLLSKSVHELSEFEFHVKYGNETFSDRVFTLDAWVGDD